MEKKEDIKEIKIISEVFVNRKSTKIGAVLVIDRDITLDDARILIAQRQAIEVEEGSAKPAPRAGKDAE